MFTVFLDFDGVLNNNKFHSSNYGDRLFDPQNIEALNLLCESVQIESIVITSTFRKGRSIDELKLMLANEDFLFSEKVKDVTPVLGGRAKEISQWLKNNPNTNPVIIDDMDLSEMILEDFYHVNNDFGLTKDLVVKILNIKL